MAKTEAPVEEAPVAGEVDETIIDRLLGLFQSNEASIEYGDDPQGWVEENLPEGTEAADVARCVPEVAEQLGGPYQANVARYNAHHGAHAQAATHSVVNEISYTYNTVYQQNAFIVAEEGSQVVNIQGDGNTVTQTQIDAEFGVEYPEDDYDDEDHEGELPEELPVDEHGDPIEDPLDEHDEDGYEGEEDPTAEGEEPWTGEEPPVEPDPMDDPTTGEEPWDQDPIGPETDHAPVDMPTEPPAPAGPGNPFDGTEEAMV